METQVVSSINTLLHRPPELSILGRGAVIVLPVMRLIVVLLFAVLSGVGCGEPAPVLLSIPVEYAPVPDSATLVLVDGGSLELQTAVLTLGDFRFERPAELAQVGSEVSWQERLAALWPLGAGRAVAHPGHNFSGNVAGELLGTWSLDLLGEAQALGTASLYSGAFATARLELPAASSPAPVGGLHVEGTYTPLEGPALPVALSVDLTYTVEGIPFEHTLDAIAPPTRLIVSIDLRHLFSYVETFEDADGDGVITTLDGDLFNTVAFGVKSTPTYVLTLGE